MVSIQGDTIEGPLLQLFFGALLHNLCSINGGEYLFGSYFTERQNPLEVLAHYTLFGSVRSIGNSFFLSTLDHPPLSYGCLLHLHARMVAQFLLELTPTTASS